MEDNPMKKWLKHIRLFRVDATGPDMVLGELESAVMEACWSLGEFGIKDVHERLSSDRAIAYTTVQTTIERLYRKGLLRRIGRGRNFVYSPAVDRGEFLTGIARRVLDSLFGGFSDPAMASLLEDVDDGDPATMERLIRAIEARRAKEE